MNREHKYRAWIDGEMIYIKNDISIQFFNASLDVDWAIMDRVYRHALYKHDSSYPDAYKSNELMEYTGLKDKNFKDVFEGDLKSWKFNNHDWIFLCYWSYLDCGFRWKLVKHNEKQDLTDQTEIHFDTEEEYYDYVIESNQRDRGMDQWSEIIGSIHENPELLK